ncbi:MAG: D-alanine--poly(phosphoribitol) ligase subunit DltA [Lactobacillus porci]|nr:D-alanine--poly(phosphoribitol) ligase subunit DltA [Lactobacillus porci]
MEKKNIIKAIDQIAVQEPDRLAYDYLGKTNTYGELKQRSDAWAELLLEKVPAKAPVMIWGGQTFDMLACFLGCVKSGHCYVPIANYSNAERIALVREVSGSPAIIAIDELPEADLTGLTVIKPEEVPASPKGQLDDSQFVSGDENFYIICTSGTTGKPKGVQISHDNLVSFVKWELADFNLPDHPRFLAQAPYSFDLSVMSIYPALLSGGELVVLPHEVTENFGALFKALPETQIDVWVSTPSFAQMCFLDRTFDAAHHPGLSHFLFCGEELPHKEVEMLKQRFPDSHVFNTYGPPETTVAVTQIEITDEVLAKYDRLPIGRVKEDTRITIDKSKGDDGESGEMIISGPSVSKAYINNPEKTEEAFFKNEAGVQSYRTGDVGYFDGDVLFYKGRIGFQIKFNGYRIELEEINFYMSQLPIVRHAVAAPIYKKDHTIKQLVAVIELNSGVARKYTEGALTKMIREGLEKDVMPYMIPQRYIYQDALPISQNGKVDIKAVIKEVNRA